MATKSQTVVKLDGKSLYKALGDNPEITIVDVRSPIEFQSEHIEGAINIPVDQFVERSNELPLDSDLVFVCRTGTRAKRAAILALDAGLNAQVLEGGILKWEKDRLPILKGKKKLAIDRQVQLTIGLGILSSLGLGFTLNKRFLAIAAIFGTGLTYAGLSGNCGLAKLLEKAPWNRIDNEDDTDCTESVKSLQGL